MKWIKLFLVYSLFKAHFDKKNRLVLFEISFWLFTIHRKVYYFFKRVSK